MLACGFTILPLISIASAVQYGYNHIPIRQDPAHVAVHFPDTDLELYAPAFLNPESVQSGFANGTQAPTSQDDMGMINTPKSRPFGRANSIQRRSWRKSPPATST